MSNGISLSNELMQGIFESLVKHDPEVEKDLMIGLQYLSAVIGYFSADYPGDEKNRNELLDQLASFTKHVADDRAKGMQQDAPAQEQQAAPEVPKGKSTATDDPAVGVWKPE